MLMLYFRDDGRDYFARWLKVASLPLKVFVIAIIILIGLPVFYFFWLGNDFY
jgi:hypothetical protein